MRFKVVLMPSFSTTHSNVVLYVFFDLRRSDDPQCGLYIRRSHKNMSHVGSCYLLASESVVEGDVQYL